VGGFAIAPPLQPCARVASAIIHGAATSFQAQQANSIRTRATVGDGPWDRRSKRDRGIARFVHALGWARAPFRAIARFPRGRSRLPHDARSEPAVAANGCGAIEVRPGSAAPRPSRIPSRQKRCRGDPAVAHPLARFIVHGRCRSFAEGRFAQLSAAGFFMGPVGLEPTANGL
jgi:hypothetical protein